MLKRILDLTYIKIFLFFLIPNILFLSFTYFSQTSRPLINADYFLVFVFLIIPYKIIRILGSIILVISIFIDALAMTIQIFPFLTLEGILYLAPFIVIAPLIYKVGCFLLILSIVLIVYLSLKLSKDILLKPAIIIVCIFSWFFYQNYFYHFKYHNNDYLGGDRMGHNNDYVIYSQTLLLNKVFNNDWSIEVKMTNKPSFTKLLDNQNGSNNLNKNNNKILFILAESLGAMKNEKIYDELLKEIFSFKDKLEFLKIKNVDFQGSTVAGELRELCNYKLGNTGYNFKNNSQEEFKDCIPNHYKEQGFNTIAIHGASSNLYERENLYSKLGFKERFFLEHFLDKKKCYAYHGVCDSELFDFIADKFKTNKRLFLYWMTLTSHAPYHKRDIIPNNRFNCNQFDIKNDGAICRNLKLHTQFFDQLADLIKKDEMKGVEIMIAGDHMPPFYTQENKHMFFKENKVLVIHFKIKNSN